MEYYVRTYGYLGVILWTILGGEEGVIAAAILAHRGYLNIVGVILASAVGGALGDQVYFYLARRYGERILKRSNRMAKALPKAERLVRQYGAAVALVSRFLLGLRITVAVVCGTFQMRALTFSLLNFLSALIWASVYSLSAYYLGRVLRDRVQSRSPVFLWGMAVLAAFGLVLWVQRRRARRSMSTPTQNLTPKGGRK